jgi:hypothetical protein
MQALPHDKSCGTWVYCGYSDGAGAGFGGDSGVEDVSGVWFDGREARRVPTHVVPLRCGVLLSLWRILAELSKSLRWTIFLRWQENHGCGGL